MTPLTQTDLDAIERQYDPESRGKDRPIRHDRIGYSADRQEAKRRARRQVREAREREVVRARWPR